MVNYAGLQDVEAYDGSGGSLPTPGEYAFEVTGATMGQSSGGHPQLTLDLVVLQGAETDAFNGRTMKHFQTLTDHKASRGRMRCILEACNVGSTNQGFNSDDFVARRFIGEVYEDNWDKPDVASGTTVEKKSTKIRRERPIDAGWSDTTSAPPAAPSAGPAPRAPAPAAPTAPAAPLPPGPRPTVAGPGLRPKAPIPTRRA
jgi:hypothetical protein